MKNEKRITIPNMLSFYRILAFPVILFFILTERETLFAIFLIINLVTDVLDGMLARMLKQETEFGARLDSMADNLTYLLAFAGVFVFKWDEFLPHLNSFLLYIGLVAVALTLSVIKFGRFPSLHLYSWKIGGYIQGAFFAVLFAWDFVVPFYYFMIIWSILGALEHIIIQLIIPDMQSNARGLYWVIKNRANTR
jgi:cardiolipin synthase (CMP-forming)